MVIKIVISPHLYSIEANKVVDVPVPLQEPGQSTTLEANTKLIGESQRVHAKARARLAADCS